MAKDIPQLTEEQKQAALAYTKEVLEKFFEEFHKAYSRSFMDSIKANNVEEHKPSAILPEIHEKDAIHFKISGFQILDQDEEKDFIDYTIKSFDSVNNKVHKVYRRFDEFKHLNGLIASRCKMAKLPRDSSGVFGLEAKQVSDEFAKKRIPQLTKYLSDCVLAQKENENGIPELIDFFFGGKRIDRHVAYALQYAFESTTQMSNVLYNDVGEGLTKYITLSFIQMDEDLKKLAEKPKKLVDYYSAMIYTINPTIEYNIFQNCKAITDANTEVGKEDLNSVDEYEKAVRDVISSSIEELFKTNEGAVNEALDEFFARLGKAYETFSIALKRSSQILKGFCLCRYPDISLIPGVSLGCYEGFASIKAEISKVFKQPTSFQDGQLSLIFSRLFSLIPLFIQLVAESVNIQQIVEIIHMVARLRRMTSYNDVEESEFKNAKKILSKAINDFYISSLYSIDNAKDSLFETLASRKEIDGNNTNSLHFVKVFLKFLNDMAEVKKDALRVFCGFYLNHGLIGISNKQLDAAILGSLHYAKAYYVKNERIKVAKLISELISAVVFEVIEGSLKVEFKDKLKDIKIAEKYIHSINVSALFDRVTDSILEEKLMSKINSKLEEAFKSAPKEKLNFFEDILKEQEVSEEEDLSGSCSCNEADCDCKGVTKIDFVFPKKLHKKIPKLLSHVELKKISGEAKSKTKSKKRPVTVEDDDEDFMSGDIVLLSEDKSSKKDKKSKESAKVEPKFEVEAKVEPKVEVNVEVGSKSSSKSDESKSDDSKSDESKSDESKSDESNSESNSESDSESSSGSRSD